MSSEPEKDVSPLRLKRPSSGTPAPAGPSPTPPPVISGDMMIGGLPPAGEPDGSDLPPVAAPRRKLTMSISADEPVEATPSGPASSEPEPAPPAIKLRVGSKPAPPPPPMPEPPDPFAGLDEPIGAPLVPLPTVPPFPSKPASGPGQAGGSAFSQSSLFSPPLSVPGSTPPPLPQANKKTKVKKTAAAKKRSLAPVLLLLGLLLLAGGGAAYYFLIFSDFPSGVVNVPAPAPAPVVEPVPESKPEPEPVLESPEAEPKAAPAPAAPVAPPPPPPPSVPFVRFSESMTISGVFQGSPARAFLNNRIVRVGDEIEPALGIRFIGVDVATKHVILEERTGAQLRVKY